MRSDLKLFAILLGALGIFDLVLVPFMIAEYHRTPGTPPMAAIILGAVLGIVTLTTALGVAQGRRWGFAAAVGVPHRRSRHQRACRDQPSRCGAGCGRSRGHGAVDRRHRHAGPAEPAASSAPGCQRFLSW